MSKKDLSDGTVLIPLNYGRFYALQANKEAKPDEGDSKR